jgi:hypothetical protein
MQKEDEKKEEKKGKNVIEEKKVGDFIIQKRKVQRKGMKEEAIYDLKIPLTIKSAISEYTEKKILALAIASLKTEYDDDVAELGKPRGLEKQAKDLFKSLSPEKQAEILKKMMEATN